MNSHDDPTLHALDKALKLALDSGNAQAESVARVNIACVYLQMESPSTLGVFEEALASVRRAQNTRSEAILSMYFAPWFVEKGDPGRALELAKRGEEIAKRGRKGHRVLSLLQLARVLYTGFSDPDQAGQAVDTAVRELTEGEIRNDTDKQVVLEAAGEAAKAALEAGDMDRTLALARIVDPAAADRIAAQRPAANVGLSPKQGDALDALYREWQDRHRAHPTPRVAELDRKTAEMLRWDPARALESGSSGEASAVRAFAERVHAVAAGALSMEDAAADSAAPLTDDDLVFCLALATDTDFNSVLPAWAVFQLVAEAATDPALAGRCFRLVAAVGHQQRDPRETMNLLRRADTVLDDGVDDALRAEVVNEMAVCQLNLQRPEPALKAAQRASLLARSAGADHMERMARGNAANALLQLQRVEDALRIFEQLAPDQEAAGELDMAQITHQNIEGCRAFLRQRTGGL